MASSALISTLKDTPHEFLQPTLPLFTDTLAYLKHALDPLAADVSTVQQQRLQEARKKRKRGEKIDEQSVLRLKQIHTDGFATEQVWEQARRVIDAACSEAEAGLERVGNRDVNGANGVLDDSEEDVEGQSDDENLGEEGVDYEVEGEDLDVDELDDEEDLKDLNGMDDDAPEDDENFDMDQDELGNDEPAEEFVADKFGLNDGFFSIEDFNRKSEFLEQQDARGDDDGAASDEEDIDWDNDPISQAGATADGDAGDEAEEDEDEDEGGPTFGDLDAASEDDDEDVDGGELDGMAGMSNTNSVMYADFFAPPAQKKRKNKKGRPNPHNFPEASANGAEREEEDVERTMASVHRDLFEDDESEQEDDEAGGLEKLDPSDPKSRRSTHERRTAALREEIRKLEAANVAKRKWTLSGEARAADRPQNSLLEEDLDFERAGKPVPVITAEVSESLEELIKRRILAHEFQDLVRRRPDDLATGKRGRLEVQLDDNKSKKGLAEEYEEEHLRRTDPNFVDVKDEKMKKEEKEIESLWKKICSDLDGLSSWNFRPKTPAPTMEIRTDAPVVAMEDARPSTGGEVAAASQLAPQEVYKGGEGGKGVREEVVGKSGLPAGREEMSREERKRRRRREKERIRKAGGEGESKGRKKRDEMLGDLKKGGVKVIGKKGDVRDVEGKEVRSGDGGVGAGGQRGAGLYKL